MATAGFPTGTLPSAYPFHTSVATPTSRSPQTQARINDLATKVFTAYDIQKMRTYIPDLQFKVEEAPLINFNMLDAAGGLKDRLGRFIAAVYLYDILTNMMRDFNERVRNVTSSNLLTTDVKEVGKIATALRGFVATYNNGTGETVYLHRIPADLLERAEADKTIMVPSPGLSPLPTTEGKSADGADITGIEVTIKIPAPTDLPMYNLASGSTTEASDDCQPARIIYQIGSGEISIAKFAAVHQDRIKKLVPGDAFDNPLIPFIRRDILAFNRLRIAILNAIDAWAVTDIALKSIENGSAEDMPGYLRKLMVADQRVSGLPQPSCGEGFAGVFYDADPASTKKAKIVDPYIVAADGSLVENPKAKFGPYCQRKRVTSDLLSGVTTGGEGRVANFHVGGARRVKKTTRRRR
eukprot:jgi/Mesvir1/10931/Mv11472-RA.1